MNSQTDRLTQSIKDLTSRRLRIEGAKTGPLAIDELLRRADIVITANATGSTDVDGFPPNSSMAGDPGKNRYPLPDEDSELGHLAFTDLGHLPSSKTTPVERAAMARKHKDDVDKIATEISRALSDLDQALHTVLNACNRFDQLRKLDGEDNADYCSWARQHDLPWDYSWQIAKTTDFTRVLPEPWPEQRRVSRFVYDFTRAQKRLPTKIEMLEYLRRGSVKLKAS